ncbi:diguanylate cyclase [Thermomonas sp.]|uniref:tetratricopeptide repeat-containing diguanylate cyclase n=1 Tax=Thermomonas sp. TaxID=1971895 RepID=UPI0024886603|nr:diguanylate cyclase [Thermomonas sp.]MDI1252448.1 diguanylate cyclase [Thermomonas sp.]
MRRHQNPWKAVLLAALCAWPFATPASVPLRGGAVEPAATREAAFDETFQKVVGPTSMEASSVAYEGYLERLQALLPAGDQAREVRLRSVYCGSRIWREPKRGLAYSDDALKRARDLHDVASEARAMLCRADYIMLISGNQRGLPEYDKVVTLLADSPEQQLLAETLEMRGDTLSLLGEQARAMIDFQRSRAAYRAAGIDHEIEPLMFSIAVGYRRVGDFVQAERYFTSAISRLQDQQNWETLATNYIQLGFLHAESGAPDKAQAAFLQAIHIASKHVDPNSVNSARLGLASTQITLGEPDTALDTLAQARAGFIKEKNTSSNDMLLILTGQALARQGEHAAALAHYEMALPLVKRNGNDRYLAEIYKLRAASQEALGHADTALEDYKRYTDLQMKLQGKMRLEQSRMLEYEYEIRRRDFENRQLRADAQAKELQVVALEQARHWQALSLVLAALFVALLSSLALRQWKKSRRLRSLTMTDPLTNVGSRIGIEHEAEQAIAMSTRTDTPLSLLMLDLDHFKAINDRYGHAAGDRVLRETAATWHAQLRGRDPLGRIGGEEFVVVCPDTALEQALLVASRLREATHALRFDNIDPALQVSVSIGAASHKQGETREDLFANADAALYRAKQRGRDRTET